MLLLPSYQCGKPPSPPYRSPLSPTGGNALLRPCPPTLHSQIRFIMDLVLVKRTYTQSVHCSFDIIVFFHCLNGAFVLLEDARCSHLYRADAVVFQDNMSYM